MTHARQAHGGDYLTDGHSDMQVICLRSAALKRLRLLGNGKGHVLLSTFNCKDRL